METSANWSAGWNYDFLSPAKICFGWGRAREVGEVCQEYGRRVMIVAGSRTMLAAGVIEELSGWLREAGMEPVLMPTLSREPQVEDVDRGVAWLRDHKAGPGDVVLGIGGGAALDLAKALAGVVTQTRPGSVQDYLEGIGRGWKIEQAPLPLVAMPTTAGTGSEATKNAVISSVDPPAKKSLRSALLVPRAVLVDPALSVSVPPAVTAATGMDAITQLIESYISRRAQPIPRALAEQGLQGVVPALLEAYTRGETRWARERMAQAALLSGMALANSGLGVAHGVAAALGVHSNVAHGLACAVMLPAALEVNRVVCEPELARLGAMMTGKRYSSVAEGVEACIVTVRELCMALNLPTRLSTLGVRHEQLPLLVRDARGNSLSGNPRELSDEELSRMLEAMW